MLPNIAESNRKSSLFNFNGSLVDRNERVSSLVQQGFRTVIGYGLNVDFWIED